MLRNIKNHIDKQNLIGYSWFRNIKQGGSKMNFSKLRGRIKEEGLSEKEFAEKISLSSATLSARLNGKVDWNLSEIKSACNVLSIAEYDIPKYFFAN